MRAKTIAILALSLMLSSFTWSATKSFSFTCRTKIVRGDQVYYEHRTHTYHFQVQVQMDHQGPAQEYQRYSHSFIHAQPEARYSIAIYNPMPVRVAVNLMIDGLNSITGSPCNPGNGRKWLLEPYSTATIQGWQVNQESLRRFYFTSKEESYAKWRSHHFGKDLTVKCGQILCSYFWSKADMERYFEENPIVETPIVQEDSVAPLMSKREQKGWGHESKKSAGTGMGEKKWNPVQSVHFHYDMGMYQEWKAVKIYYDFPHLYPKVMPKPMPWKQRPDVPEFAPEQP